MATRKPSNPNAVAIHAVAKAANLSSRELMDTIEQWDLGWDATNHMKRLSPEQIQEVEKRLEVKVLDTLQEQAAKAAAAKKRKPKAASAKPRKPAVKADEGKKSDEKASDKPAKKAAKADGKPAEKDVKAEGKPANKSAKPKTTKKSDAKKTADKAVDKPADDKKSPKSDEKKSAAKKADKTPAKKSAKTDEKQARAPKDKKPGREDVREQEPEAAKLSPEEISDRARTILADILDGMGFPHPRISVDVGPNAVRISLTGRGIADIIGQRNASANVDVIEALQLVVQKSLFGNEHRHGPAVAIDVMGFREGRQQELRAMANRMAEYVARTGNVLRVAGMNFIDRRAVHQGLYDNENARTESVGYGAMRSLEVSKGERDARRNEGRDEQSSSDDKTTDDAPAKKPRGRKAPKKNASDKKGRSKDAAGQPSADQRDASEE